ncbi:MAG: hypothetical protein V4635_08635 [Bacteroidota bacterium]
MPTGFFAFTLSLAVALTGLEGFAGVLATGLATTFFFGAGFCLITFLIGFFVAGFTAFLGAGLFIFFAGFAFTLAAVALAGFEAGFALFLIGLADGLDFLSFLMSFFLAIITALVNLIFQ